MSKINYSNTFATKHSRDYYRGASFHYSGEWIVGAHYLSDDYEVDFVVHGQCLLACAKSHLSTLENEPIEYIKDERGTIIGVVSTYWDFVLSGIQGKTSGIKIVDNYWYICDDVNLPEDKQVWTSTGVKANFEFEDLTDEQVRGLQRPGLEVVNNFIADVISQQLGDAEDKVVSQKTVTEELAKKVDNTEFEELASDVSDLEVVNQNLDMRLTADVNALAAGAVAKISISPECVYRNEPTLVTITGEITEVIPQTITLGGLVSKSEKNRKQISVSTEVTISKDEEVTLTAEYMSLQFTDSAKIQCVEPIYYGFGSDYLQVINSGSKLSARTSAEGIYPTATCSANNQHFYIIYSVGIPELKGFTVGGVELVMNYERKSGTAGSLIWNRVYTSEATYNTGAQLTVTAI